MTSFQIQLQVLTDWFLFLPSFINLSRDYNLPINKGVSLSLERLTLRGTQYLKIIAKICEKSDLEWFKFQNSFKITKITQENSVVRNRKHNFKKGQWEEIVRWDTLRELVPSNFTIKEFWPKELILIKTKRGATSSRVQCNLLHPTNTKKIIRVPWFLFISFYGAKSEGTIQWSKIDSNRWF